MMKKEAIQIYGLYMRVVKPLGQLERLERLSVKAAWLWQLTERGRWRRREEREGWRIR